MSCLGASILGDWVSKNTHLLLKKPTFRGKIWRVFSEKTKCYVLTQPHFTYPTGERSLSMVKERAKVGRGTPEPGSKPSLTKGSP